jgi:hypothetical protein
VTVWDHLPARSLIDLQRIAALEKMGQEASRLYIEGYLVDADRVLDEINERKRSWMDEAA